MSAAPSGPAAPFSRRALARWLGALGGSLALFVAACLLAPFVPVDPTASVGAAVAAYLVGLGAVAAMTLAVGATVPPVGRGALAAVVPIALVLGALAWLGPSAAEGRGIAPGALVLVLLLAGGSLVGSLVGSRILAAGHLSVVVVASSLADLWSVLAPGAPSAEIAASEPLLSVLALSFPMLGTSAIEPLLGVGDVVFVALYASASRRFSLGLGRTLVALAGGLAATAAFVIATERPIPALPLLGVAVLLAHPEARLPPPGERRTAALGLAILAALVVCVLAGR